MEVRAASNHPSLSLVARDGDPFFGIALAAAHDLGATASLWTEALLEERIAAATSQSVEPRPSSNGFVLRARISSPEQATRFVRAAHDALSTSLTAAEFLRLVERVNEGADGAALGERRRSGRRANASASSAEPRRSRRPSATWSIFVRQSFRPTASPSRSSVRTSSSKRRQRRCTTPTFGRPASAPSDAWPASDLAGTAPGDPGSPALSVALHLADPARALEAAKVLGGRNSAQWPTQPRSSRSGPSRASSARYAPAAPVSGSISRANRERRRR